MEAQGGGLRGPVKIGPKKMAGKMSHVNFILLSSVVGGPNCCYFIFLLPTCCQPLDMPSPIRVYPDQVKAILVLLSLGVGYLVCIHTFLPSEVPFAFAPIGPGVV